MRISAIGLFTFLVRTRSPCTSSSPSPNSSPSRKTSRRHNSNLESKLPAVLPPREDSPRSIPPTMPSTEDHSTSTMSDTTDIKSALGTHIVKAANARKAFEQATSKARCATTAMSKGLDTASKALQSLPDIQSTLDDITHNTVPSTTDTHAAMRDELISSKKRVRALESEHDKAISAAWDSWGEAMTAVMDAGEAQDAHATVIQKLENMITQNMTTTDMNHITGALSAMRREHGVLGEDLVKLMEEVKGKLAEAPKIFAKHRKEWKVGIAGAKRRMGPAESAVVRMNREIIGLGVGVVGQEEKEGGQNGGSIKLVESPET